MLSVTCKWDDGQWALILGIVRDELDGIWDGRQIALPVRNLPHTVAAPVLFVLMRTEDFARPGVYDTLLERIQERFPDEDTVIPVIIDEDARMALEDYQALRFPSEKTFAKTCPTGWKQCRFVEIRYRRTEDELVACLQGQHKHDLREPEQTQEPYTPGNE